MTIINSLLIGIFPLALILILPNVIHQELLTKVIQSILAVVPDSTYTDHDHQPTIISTKESTKDRRRSIFNSAITTSQTLPEIQVNEKIKEKISNGDIRKESSGATAISRGIDMENEPASSSTTSTSTSTSTSTYARSSSSERHTTSKHQERASPIDQHITYLQNEFQNDSSNFIKALNYADILRQRDLMIHDGGSIQKQSIKVYKHAIKLIKHEWKSIVAHKGDVRLSLTSSTTRHYENVMKEALVPNEQKSIHGLLVTAYCSLGKQYYMANMFEKAVEAYNSALKLESHYIDALNSRGSAYVILGKYHDAGNDFVKVLSIDGGDIVTDVFSGLAKVLVANEDVVENGWDDMVNVLNEKISKYENILESLHGNNSNNPDIVQGRRLVTDKLKVMHLAMFSYHDHKTNDTKQAFHHLKISHQHKMSSLPPYNHNREQMKVQTIMQVFNSGFWPEGVGSVSSKKLIFIVGFPRSGSTLLERVLDSHSNISGTGEDSIFNGMLDEIRNSIIEASRQQNPVVIQKVVEHYAEKVEDLVMHRWLEIQRNNNNGGRDFTASIDEHPEVPTHFVDKMLTNYANIGFIHLLFPNALVLHIFREPMDTLFSCYKHEFPPGNLDYTSDFNSLSHMYKNYRDIMTHWERVLPGRVMHIKYEDMVNDLPMISKVIMSRTDLEFEPQMLEFHKKKQAVNTHSSVQVRKGVYKGSIHSWKKYESFLKPLHRLLRGYAHHDFQTTGVLMRNGEL